MDTLTVTSIVAFTMVISMITGIWMGYNTGKEVGYMDGYRDHDDQILTREKHERRP